MWISCTWEDSLMKMVKRIHKAPCLPSMLYHLPSQPFQNETCAWSSAHIMGSRWDVNHTHRKDTALLLNQTAGTAKWAAVLTLTFLNTELIWLRSSEGDGDQPLHLKHTGQKETVNLTKRKPSSIYYSNQNVERWHFLGRIQQLQLCYINNKIKLNGEHSFITPKSGNSQITLQVSDTS